MRFLADAFTLDVGDNLLNAINLIANAITLIIVQSRTKELRPNGGDSMKDKVEKLYRTVAANDRANDPHKGEPDNA